MISSLASLQQTLQSMQNLFLYPNLHCIYISLQRCEMQTAVGERHKLPDTVAAHLFAVVDSASNVLLQRPCISTSAGLEKCWTALSS